jgi:hypothetical protein
MLMDFNDLIIKFECLRTTEGISLVIDQFEEYCDYNSVNYEIQHDGINTSAILHDRDTQTGSFFVYKATIGTFLLNQVEYFLYRPFEIKDRNRSDTGYFTQHATSISNILKNLNSSSAIKDPMLTIAFDKLIALLLNLGNGKLRGKGNRTKEIPFQVQLKIVSIANDLLSKGDYPLRRKASVSKQLVLDTYYELSNSGYKIGLTAVRKYLEKFSVHKTFLSSR